MKSAIHFFIPLIIILFAGCNKSNNKYDATGTFEADEIIISAEANGKILRLAVEEGAILAKDSVVGNIDPSTITLEKDQAASNLEALNQKTNDPAPLIEILQSQMEAQTKQIAVL